MITAADGRRQVVDADRIVIATGSRPVRPPSIEFDEESILDSDGILNLKQIPQSLVVVGAGVIGIEYASMFAAVGTKVTVVDTRRELLPFCDSEIVRALQLSLRDLGVIFRLGETVEAVERHESGALIMLKSGKRIAAETVLYSAGRAGRHRRASASSTSASRSTSAARSRSTSTTARRSTASTRSAT